MWLFKRITGLVSENPLPVNVLNEYQKLLKSAEKAFLSYFFIILSQIDLHKVIFNQIWDFRAAF